MKKISIIFGLLVLASPVQAQWGSNPNSHYTNGHYNSNGTYVQPHYRTNPNATQQDNYGTSGNYNPHTGSFGTRTPRW